jgi:hypothetical protein
MKRHPILLHRLAEAWHILGPSLGWIAPLWLIRPSYRILVRDLAGPLPEPVRSDLSCARLTDGDVPELLEADPLLTRAEVRRRLRDGEECYLYCLGPDLAHYRWETTRPTYLPYIGKTARPLTDDVFACGAFTVPRYRPVGREPGRRRHGPRRGTAACRAGVGCDPVAGRRRPDGELQLEVRVRHSGIL